MAWVWFHRFGSPPYFYRLARRLTPWFAWPALLLSLAGLTWGLAFTPPEAHQGDGFRIIYVHVPAAWLSVQVYVVMALSAAIGLIWRMKVAHAVAASCATVGASFTVLALGTGMLWGKPMWGTFWPWDPRTTSELLLLFLYLGYIGLRSGFDDTARADRASAVLAIVGVVDAPVVHYSVVWWNSLHQGSSLIRAGGPAIAPSMLFPLLVMILAFYCYCAAVVLVRARGEILRRERNAQWLAEELSLPGGSSAGPGGSVSAGTAAFKGATRDPLVTRT
jgi:heme exporter protein C